MCADGFEGQVATDLGAGGNNDLGVGEMALACVVRGHPDSVVFRIEALSFPEDELEVVGRVLGEAWFNGEEQLLVGNGARDDTADGGNVPVEAWVGRDEEHFEAIIFGFGKGVLEQFMGEWQPGPAGAENDDRFRH